MPVVSLAFNNVAVTPAVATAFVNDLYQDVLFRGADPGGLAFWTGQLQAQLPGGGGGSAFGGFLASAEFQSIVNPIPTMYQAYLSRPADVAGLAGWVDQERAGQSLAQIAGSIAATPEFQADNGNVFALSNASRSWTSSTRSCTSVNPVQPKALSGVHALDTQQETATRCSAACSRQNMSRNTRKRTPKTQ